MERVKLSEKLEFSRLIYGMWRLADDVDTSVSHVETKINKCLEQGITTFDQADIYGGYTCLLYTSPSPRDGLLSRMPSSA